MISVGQREAIRRAYFVEEKSVRQVAREFHCSRKTIRKTLASAEPAPYTLRVPRTAPVLDPYKERNTHAACREQHDVPQAALHVAQDL